MPQYDQRLAFGSSQVVGLDGVARIILSPAQTRAVWKVARMTVTVANEAGSPSVLVYLNTEAAPNLLGGTYSGAFDTSDEPNPIVLQPSESLIFVFVGATPGLTASANVVGTAQLGG